MWVTTEVLSYKKMEKLLSLWVEGLNKKNIPLTQAVITPQTIKINAGALQWCLQNFHCSGLQTYKSKCKKFNCFILLNVVLLFYTSFNWFIFIKMLFLHSLHSFHSITHSNIVLLLWILRGAWNITHRLPII
jgi:hypothetical protein